MLRMIIVKLARGMDLMTMVFVHDESSPRWYLPPTLRILQSLWGANDVDLEQEL